MKKLQFNPRQSKILIIATGLFWTHILIKGILGFVSMAFLLIDLFVGVIASLIMAVICLQAFLSSKSIIPRKSMKDTRLEKIITVTAALYVLFHSFALITQF